MLFNDYQRVDSTIKANRESEFAFLDRSARPEMERVREFLERLAEAYPAEEVSELSARIRSGDDTQFKSAIFELILHEYLLRLGYTLIPHPELPNGSKARPDFHVISPKGDEFYLEAVLASVNDGSDKSAEARMGTTLDALAKACHPNFMVAVEGNGIPTTQPSSARLKLNVMSWLDSLDPDEIQAVMDAHDLFAAPTLTWSHEGWTILFRPIPIKPERRGRLRLSLVC